MNDNTRYVPTFTSSASALRTLRAGKRNPNWRAAAEYLMERAAPDVRLLIEAASQIEVEKLQTDRRSLPPRRKDYSWMHWLLLTALGSSFIALLIWILQNATLRSC